MVTKMTIDPMEAMKKANARENALARVRGDFGRCGVQKDRKKNASKYACRNKGRNRIDW